MTRHAWLLVILFALSLNPPHAFTTAQMPAAETAASDHAPQKKKRSPWTWPLVALIVLLVLVIGGTLWALFSNQNADPQDTPKTTQSTASTPKTTPSETTPESVNVDALNLVGMTCEQATAALEAEELKANCVAGDAASYRYLAESIRRFPDQEALLEMMRDAGLEDCRYHNLAGGIVALHRGQRY